MDGIVTATRPDRASEMDRFIAVLAVRDGHHVDAAQAIAAELAATGNMPLTVFDAGGAQHADGVPDGARRVPMSPDRFGDAVAAEVAGRDGVLVVVDAHGGGPPGDALFDVDAEQLLRRVRQPVLVIGPRAAAPTRPWRLIVPIDGAPDCRATPVVVIRWRNSFGAAPVTVVALDAPDSWPPDGTDPVVDAARTTMAALGRGSVDATLVRRATSDPAAGMLDALDAERGAVVVVPAPQAAHTTQWWSTLRRLVRDAPCPVLAVPVDA